MLAAFGTLNPHLALYIKEYIEKCTLLISIFLKRKFTHLQHIANIKIIFFIKFVMIYSLQNQIHKYGAPLIFDICSKNMNFD